MSESDQQKRQGTENKGFHPGVPSHQPCGWADAYAFHQRADLGLGIFRAFDAIRPWHLTAEPPGMASQDQVHQLHFQTRHRPAGSRAG